MIYDSGLLSQKYYEKIEYKIDSTLRDESTMVSGVYSYTYFLREIFPLYRYHSNIMHRQNTTLYSEKYWHRISQTIPSSSRVGISFIIFEWSIEIMQILLLGLVILIYESTRSLKDPVVNQSSYTKIFLVHTMQYQHQITFIHLWPFLDRVREGE